MHGEALGYEAQLVAKSFHQHAAVALDLIDPVIYFIEPAVYPLESAVYPLESPVDLLEPLIVPVQPLLNAVKSLTDPIKSLIKILNKFLIHGPSASWEEYAPWLPLSMRHGDSAKGKKA